MVHGGQSLPPEATWGRSTCGGWGMIDAWQHPGTRQGGGARRWHGLRKARYVWKGELLGGGGDRGSTCREGLLESELRSLTARLVFWAGGWLQVALMSRESPTKSPQVFLLPLLVLVVFILPLTFSPTRPQPLPAAPVLGLWGLHLSLPLTGSSLAECCFLFLSRWDSLAFLSLF